jgi:hypothetical protein
MASPGPERTLEQGGSGHPRIVAALLLIGTLLAFVAIFSIWVNRQALNTDNWVDTSGKLLRNEEIRAQLSGYLADELFANVDVQAELEKTFPPRLAPLAGPAAGALHQLAPQVAERALATSQAESLWADANRAAHETLLKILNDEGSAVSTGNGEVTLDLASLVSESGGQLGVAGKLASKIPPDAGRLTILKSDQLSMAQDASSLVRHLPVVLTLLVLLLYGLAVYLSGPRRRQALRAVGFGFLIAGVLSLLLRQFAGNTVTDALAGNESVKPAVEAAWDIGTSLLVTVAVSAIAFGILLVIAAWIAGPTRIATSLREGAAPYLRERRGTTYAAVSLVFLALILWAPVVAFHKPIGLILLAALMVLGTEMLRRQTAVEFPDAQFGGFGERLRATAPRRAEARPPSPAAPSKVEELERLSALKAQGSLSDEEFEAAKSEILAR